MKIIDSLIGTSAGKICFSNFEQHDFYMTKLIDEASVIWESGRSAWTLLSQDTSGQTRWLSPEEDKVAFLLQNQEIFVEDIS